MTDPNAPLREVRRWMRVSTPVNKATSAGLRGRLPQIAGPLMIGALGVGALGAGIAWRALSSTRGTGRTQRFVDLATAALDSGFPLRVDEAGAGSYVERRDGYLDVSVPVSVLSAANSSRVGACESGFWNSVTVVTTLTAGSEILMAVVLPDSSTMFNRLSGVSSTMKMFSSSPTPA